MIEFIKKNKKIIISSSIFYGINSNIYCGCGGICDDNNDKKTTTSTTTDDDTKTPKKEETPTGDETEKNQIISQCEKLIVEIKKLKNDYDKTVNKNDTIENLKALKTQLETDLNNLKIKNSDETPEKTEKEKLIDQIIKITDEGIKNATELDKKILKYLYFTNINKTDEELKDKLIEHEKLSKENEDVLKNVVIAAQNYFKNRSYEKFFINKKMQNFDFNFLLQKYLVETQTISGTDDYFRTFFFSKENKSITDSEEDKFYAIFYKYNNFDYNYCIFNKKIYDKIDKRCYSDIFKLSDDLYVFVFKFLGDKYYKINLKEKNIIYDINPDNLYFNIIVNNELF